MKPAASRAAMLLLPLAVLMVLILPFAAREVWKPAASGTSGASVAGRDAASDQLVIITPQLEPVRRKFSAAFSRWYADSYHRSVSVEYLNFTGGEIVRYFLTSAPVFESSGTYNIDVVWGGSDSTYNDVLKRKYLERIELDPALMRAAYPQPDIGGVPLYDSDLEGPRWFGAALSSFGILYNRDMLRFLQLPEPRTWSDLADPRYRGWLVLADPTRSASAKAALTVIVEREMQSAKERNQPQRLGWSRGMGLIRRIAANARAFTAAANELPGYVSNGDAAAAMVIDFYARSQMAAVGDGRLGYVEPQGATMVSPEPIAVVRGARHPEVARRFIEFVLSERGQRLWIDAAAAGETPEMALHRLPIRPSVYEHRQDSGIPNPFHTAGGFNSDPARRRSLGLMDELVALCCIDLLPELRATRQQIIASPRAVQLDGRLGMFPIDQNASQAGMAVHDLMLNGSPQAWLTLQREWRFQFRREYGDLRRLASQPAGAAR